MVGQTYFTIRVEVNPIGAIMNGRHQVVDDFSGSGACVGFHKHFSHDFMRYLLARPFLVEDVRGGLNGRKIYHCLSGTDRGLLGALPA